MAKKEPLTYCRAEEVEDIAEALITDYHQHLGGETILFLFRSEHTEEKGRVVLGKARKISGLNAYLASKPPRGADDEPTEPPILYVIEVARDTWNGLTASQRIALVDHELSHITADGLRAHDVEEFSDVIKRHGLWKQDLKEFAEAAKQTHLFEAVEALRPKRGSGISKVTISSGNKKVELTPRDDVH